MNATTKAFLYVGLPLLIIVLAGIGYYFSRSSKTNSPSSVTIPIDPSEIRWEESADGWRANGTPPDCPSPRVLTTPVDLSKVSAILYPGQTRGGQYKPHGGFRFDGQENDAITVKAPLDAKLVLGSRYIEGGEVQYLLEFVNACGIAYRFDHLLTLNPTIQAEADKLPEAKVDDSRTTRFDQPISVKAGQEIATAVGFAKTNNVSVDFGVYDYRKKNEASQDSTWAANHSDDRTLAPHALCWFDLLSDADEAKVRTLPAGDSVSGKTSDYCK